MMIDDDYQVDINGIRNSEAFYIVLASISMILTSSMVFILLFRYGKLVSGKTVSHLVLMISISLFLSSLASVIGGYPVSQSSTCYFQSFVWLFFMRSSWLYTDLLILQITSLVFHNQYYKSLSFWHRLIWSMNIFLQVLPYMTHDKLYSGINDDYLKEPIRSCATIFDIGSSTISVHNYIFLVGLLISLFFISFFSIILVIFINIASSLNMKVTPHVYKSFSIIILFPVGMIVAWVPVIISGFWITTYITIYSEMPPQFNIIYNYTSALNSLYGILLFIVFFKTSGKARKEMMTLTSCKKKEADDDRITETEVTINNLNESVNRIIDVA